MHEGATLHISRDHGPVTVLSLGPEDLSAAHLQARVDEAIGPGALVVRDASPGRLTLSSAAPRPSPTPAPKDRRGWLKASWASIGGGDPSRERRFHALGCQWKPASRQWSCAGDCNVPAWREEEANADE